MTNMMLGTGELRLAQQDGGLPTTLATGSAPGESGVSVLSVRFRGGAHLSVTTRQHLVCFVSQVRIECYMAGRALRHEAAAGSLAICPAGIDAVADTEDSVDAILVAIDPGRLALAAAEDAALEAQLMEHLLGFDQALLDLARTLASEARTATPTNHCSGTRLQAVSLTDWLVVIRRSSKAGREASWATRYSGGLETTSLPTSMSRSRSPRWQR
jgi:hypothetical protein